MEILTILKSVMVAGQPLELLFNGETEEYKIHLDNKEIYRTKNVSAANYEYLMECE
jgi:hypothetical protein